MLIKVAWASLMNRRLVVILAIVLICISTAVLLGVEHIRKEARDSFSRTVSGTDLIVGARTGQINLLLYSVFHMGNATNNIDWSSYRQISDLPGVSWTVPLSLGDSHRGYRVVGTTPDYFEHFRYGNRQPLELARGIAFDDLHEAVIGAEVATRLGYEPGDSIVLSHGTGGISFSHHEDQPFHVTGILAPTGTPVDKTVLVSLESIEAIHRNWPGNTRALGSTAANTGNTVMDDLEPESITAFLVGLESPLATFSLQRLINNYPQEPLLAILPGVALSELWEMLGILEKVLGLIVLLVLLASLLGMSVMLLSTLKQRERELAIMRALGAHPSFIFLLIEVEALIITVLGIVFGYAVLMAMLLLGESWLVTQYGLFISTSLLNIDSLRLIIIILAGAALLALIPAIGAYRGSLSRNLRGRL